MSDTNLTGPNRMTLRVARGAEGEGRRYDAFEVPYEDGANACKECMILVDGKVDYACTARLASGTVTVEPLANKRLVRDLVTDIVPPKERLDADGS